MKKSVQNIFDICINKTNTNNIAKIKTKHCDNKFCIESSVFNCNRITYRKICKNTSLSVCDTSSQGGETPYCKSIICCGKCSSIKNDKCAICLLSKPNIKISIGQKCKSCEYYLKMYICKNCDRLVLHCNTFCDYSMSGLCGYVRCKDCNNYVNSMHKFIKFNELE